MTIIVDKTKVMRLGLVKGHKQHESYDKGKQIQVEKYKYLAVF